ncbi:hypothetical protein [Thiocapsa sp. N5-Cardenillas]|uniref:hypothetical protein n=1 Tax=Thiocapsa sp. N5-Cardenillas TaxID=3137397 RepID=UPI0035B48C11
MISDLLKNPKRMLQWSDPWIGSDPDGKEFTVAVCQSATVEDCIKIQRRAHRVKTSKTFTDRQLLEDFLTINWAEPAPELPESISRALTLIDDMLSTYSEDKAAVVVTAERMEAWKAEREAISRAMKG